MNRNEYMAALRRALSGLPDEERANALRYYEEYFDDAGPENEGEAIAGLGAPESVAAQILNDYRELTVPPHRAEAGGASYTAAGEAANSPKRRWRGINPWLLALLVLLAIPVGIPLAAAVGGVLISVLAVLACIVLVVFIIFAVIPFVLLVCGAAFIGVSFFLWWTPASAVLTLGAGLAVLAIGILVTMLMIKLCTLFIPPIFRGFVAILRWPFDKLRGAMRK